MKVLKFGGTSVSKIDILRDVKKIVEACNEQVIVVVSALGGITDQLITAARLASEGDKSYKDIYAGIIRRHDEIINSDLVPDNKRLELVEQASQLYGKLENLYKSIELSKQLSSTATDYAESFGERLSSLIIGHIFPKAGIYDSLRFIESCNHVANLAACDRMVKSTFSDFSEPIAVVPGFISTDSYTGKISNLDRGGSDYTAAIIAASLDAESLEIWTDVDGFMTADPRIIKDAKVINSLTYNEAFELCEYGAKVIYYPTIIPVNEKNIPILVKNTFNPSAPGTTISEIDEDDTQAVKGVSSTINDDKATIAVVGKDLRLNEHIIAVIEELMKENNIATYANGQHDSNDVYSFGVDNSNHIKALNLIHNQFFL
jgi:aspartokinase/homoserine dehydrogenase 1